MIFLDGAATTAEIKRLTDSSKKVRMAVAFWGDGATDGLGLEAKGQSATIICNLKSGGTNPHEIQKLINNKVFVLQCDTLHGKVYLFDDHVILGSSNASANGLALQGKELSGWHEANILTSERVILRDAEQWINRLETRVVSPIDMEEAKLAFSKRRAAASVVAPAVVPLVDALKAHPESFKDRRIFVCAYLSRFEQADIDRVEKEQAKHGGGHTVDAVGWRVPTDARLLLFYINSRGKVTYDGFWERPKTEWKSGGRSPIYFMSKIKNIDGSSAIGIGEAWEPALLAFRDAEISGSDSEAKHIELGDFYERYLLHTKTKTLIQIRRATSRNLLRWLRLR